MSCEQVNEKQTLVDIMLDAAEVGRNCSVDDDISFGFCGRTFDFGLPTDCTVRRRSSILASSNTRSSIGSIPEQSIVFKEKISVTSSPVVLQSSTVSDRSFDYAFYGLIDDEEDMLVGDLEKSGEERKREGLETRSCSKPFESILTKITNTSNKLASFNSSSISKLSSKQKNISQVDNIEEQENLNVTYDIANNGPAAQQDATFNVCKASTTSTRIPNLSATTSKCKANEVIRLAGPNTITPVVNTVEYLKKPNNRTFSHDPKRVTRKPTLKPSSSQGPPRMIKPPATSRSRIPNPGSN